MQKVFITKLDDIDKTLEYISEFDINGDNILYKNTNCMLNMNDSLYNVYNISSYIINDELTRVLLFQDCDNVDIEEFLRSIGFKYNEVTYSNDHIYGEEEYFFDRDITYIQNIVEINKLVNSKSYHSNLYNRLNGELTISYDDSCGNNHIVSRKRFANVLEYRDDVNLIDESLKEYHLRYSLDYKNRRYDVRGENYNKRLQLLK